MTDYEQLYRTLRLSPRADIEDLRRDYRELAHRWHPDRYRRTGVPKEAAEAIFKEITMAYHRLSQYHKMHKVLPFQNTGIAPINIEAAAVDLPKWQTRAGVGSAVGLAVLLGILIIAHSVLRSEGGFAKVPLGAGDYNLGISVGDSPEKVVDLLGEPEQLSRALWQYERVEVYFAAGKVSGWRNKKPPAQDGS